MQKLYAFVKARITAGNCVQNIASYSCPSDTSFLMEIVIIRKFLGCDLTDQWDNDKKYSVHKRG